MSKDLVIGTGVDGQSVTLPADLGDKKIAVVAQSNKGKTYGLGVILEELAKAKRPFIATDPANNLWGLRVKPDGTPSGLPVVVIGGPHGDIAFDKDAGERVAEALLATPQCAVLDLSMESQGSKRKFMTAFAERLMRQRCPFPLPIILEEAPDLIPQRALGAASFCKAAVAKLATIGGNFGYGVIPATQRPATLDKDVLSQCEALIVMGMTHKKDRATVAEWIEAKDIGERVSHMFKSLGSLEPGQAWLWWPGEDRFEQFTFRRRETLHPREMKKLGLQPSAVQLGDSQEFVARLRKEMAKTTAAAGLVSPKLMTPKALSEVVRRSAQDMAPMVAESQHIARQLNDQAGRIAKLDAEVEQLSKDRYAESQRRQDAERRLEAVRKQLRPQYEAMRDLFEDLGQAASAKGGAAQDLGVWEPWLGKAGKAGCRRILETLLQRGRMTMRQLATLAGVQYGNRSWRNYKSWLQRNSLVTIDGEDIAPVQL